METNVLDTSVVQAPSIENQQQVELARRELAEAELLAVGGGTGEVTW